MWKFVSAVKTLSLRSRSHTHHAISIGKRCFLSEAFQCKSIWGKRLQAPVLQNADLDELYYKLDQKFNHYGKASVVDIDVFANAVRNESYAAELEDLIYKLQLSVNRINPLPSTHHAVIRYFLDTEQYEPLLRILNDRLVYGVFPDSFCLCLILDTFIKKKLITEAARVSSIHMLQEDWSNPLVTSLALYACHMYIQNRVPWERVVEEKNSGVEIKVQVEYIRYPYFDDSLDIQDPQLLVGKTLADIGATMLDAVGQTYRVIGLGLYRKWEEAILLLKQLPSSGVKPGIFRAGVQIFEETFGKELNDNNDPESKLRETLRSLVKELDNQGLVTNDDLHVAVVTKVEEIVAREENNIISAQVALYREWENTREQLLKEEMEALKREERLSVIDQEKLPLIEGKQELSFFDTDEKVDLDLEKQELQKKEEENIPKGKKSKDLEESKYVLPGARSGFSM